MSFEFPAHGGDIYWAESTFGIHAEEWLDLSTGISPWVWRGGEFTDSILQRLPYRANELTQAAAGYYGCKCKQIISVPGSQFAISRLPRYWAKCNVAIPYDGYQEHRIAWESAGHIAHAYKNISELEALCLESIVQVAVVINPNNPTGTRFSKEDLSRIEQLLIDKTGINRYGLIIDEAFLDLNNEESFIPLVENNGTVVLRSIGKFFGLAGLRVGFMVTPAGKFWNEFRARELMPWLVSHPSEYCASAALQDIEWHNQQKTRIREQSSKLHRQLTTRYKDEKVTNAGLFVSVLLKKEKALDEFKRYAKQGVLTRYIPSTNSLAFLRFGLPGEQTEQLSRVL